MTVRSIGKFSNPLLRAVAEPVELFDDDLQALASDLIDTMRAAPGIGADLQHIGGGHRNGRAAAVVERVLIRNDGVQRVVAACEVDDNEIARDCALRAGDVREERRGGEADCERRHAIANEFPPSDFGRHCSWPQTN